MEEADENGQEIIHLNSEEADYFVAQAQLTAANLRMSAGANVLGVSVVFLILFFGLLQVLHGNMAALCPVALSVFWIGFFFYRAVIRARDARKVEAIAGRLLQEIGKEEIRRALEDGGHDDE
jgi:hypothetical protein